MFENLLSLFVRLCAAAVLIGWLLSIVGKLDAVGYLVVGIPTLAVVAVTAAQSTQRSLRFNVLRRPLGWWKHKRFLPLIYLILLGLVVCGGAGHEPNNFDGLSYRIPKVLYWLDQHRWHWIDAPYHPINYTLPNYEWLTIPFFLLTGGFHASVLINLIGYTLLPSLFFSLLRTFDVSPRVAYDWMWLLPSGYMVVMQAGGIGNDLLGLVTILGALYFARRFLETGQTQYLLDTVLAAAFCTGVKLSNIPLAGFAAVLLLKDPRRLRSKRWYLVAGTILSITISAVVPLSLNFAHTGSILGTTAGEDQTRNPVAGLVGNALITFIAALEPPVCPAADQVSGWLEHGLPHPLPSWLATNYPKFTMKVKELPQEEGGALGIGITVCFIVAACLALTSGSARSRSACGALLSCWQRRVWWCWLGVGLLVLFAKLGTGPAFPRNLLPWSPVLLAPVLACIQREQIMRRRIWKIVTPLAMLSAVPALMLTPSRPLIPPSLLLKSAVRAGIQPRRIERLRVVYEVYSRRADPFAMLRAALPVDTTMLGLVSDGNEPTSAWWLPYGSRRCIYLLNPQAIAAARAAGIRNVVLKDEACRAYFQMEPRHWMEVYRAKEIESADVTVFASLPPFHYMLVELLP